MKLGKTIAIMALSILLALSVSMNIFIFVIFGIKDVQSFKQVLLSKELLDSLTTSVPESTPDVNTPELDTEAPEQVPEVEDTSAGDFYYTNAWIKVKELKQGVGLMGPTITIELENISDEAIRVSFKDLSIDGYASQYSSTGVYSEVLDPGMKAIREISLWKSDYEAFTSKPKEIRFIIDIMDPRNYASLIEPTPAEITIK
jgi:hypothetical protein